jgi:hypothetical protein
MMMLSFELFICVLMNDIVMMSFYVMMSLFVMVVMMLADCSDSRDSRDFIAIDLRFSQSH